MTIQEAIERACRAEPNAFSPIEMTEWLSRLDMQIYSEVIATHEDAGEKFSGYSGETPPDTALLVPAPYDLGIYLNYLEAEIHKRSHEGARYNQSVSLFNEAMALFENRYNSEHLPLSKVKRFCFK